MFIVHVIKNWVIFKKTKKTKTFQYFVGSCQRERQRIETLHWVITWERKRLVNLCQILTLHWVITWERKRLVNLCQILTLHWVITWERKWLVNLSQILTMVEEQGVKRSGKYSRNVESMPLIFHIEYCPFYSTTKPGWFDRC